ncbi:MAG: hypothetical protein JXM70_14305 [Pirellulales bacterium]|nr:hypothetical protein [Pirellulales bacterium]
MEKVKENPTNQDETTSVKQPAEADLEAWIKSQVLAKIGKPLRLDRVEVSLHHGNKYRVNIWQQSEPDRNLALTITPRIGPSYYLTVSGTGEIIDSNPPLTRLCPSD